jgi:glycerophosphoryl diester phosphodiesterase
MTSQPILIAHRGASGERPEHTLEAYALAIEQGADYIEPDLVLTRDGVLVARHENEISGTTDVAVRPEFASRKSSRTIGGEKYTGWFTEDFTLKELKTLRAKERLPQLRRANSAFDGQFSIPTFDEIISLAKEQSRATGRTIGVYPETKHPGYFAAIGLPHEAPLIAALDAAGWTTADAPVFVQSFEVGNLKALAAKTGVRLIQLVSAGGAPADQPGTPYSALIAPSGLAEIARYAQGIGPQKDLVVPRSAIGTLKKPTALVRDAHAAGLAVHPWTFRRENHFLPLAMKSGLDPSAHGAMGEEIAIYLDAGIDGLFSDNVREARAAIDQRAAAPR